jgi:hypothetical protein
MDRLAEFDLTLTLCFTPARLGVEPHHTSPPLDLTLFADFCEAVISRYGSTVGLPPFRSRATPQLPLVPSS